MLRLKLNKTIKKPIIIFSILLLIAIAYTQWEKPPRVLAQNAPPVTVVINGTNGAMAPEGKADPHIRLTPERAITPAEQVRADQLAQQIRRAIEKYSDVKQAEEAGYLQFPPDADDLTMVHYTHPWLSYLETWRLDPEQPGSLLYERRSDGSLRLLGAMFSAPAETTVEVLDERVPLSISRWHLHVNICVPDPIWDEQEWARVSNKRSLFGPESSIATESECSSVGGEFLPTVFGWMIHANVFADNPEDVWNHMYGGDRPDTAM